MGERVTTERARELLADLEIRHGGVSHDGLRKGWPILTHESGRMPRCAECGVVAHPSASNCEAWAASLRYRSAKVMVRAAAPDLAADLIAARERIAALEAERDARVTRDDIDAGLRNVGYDPECSACAGIFWSGVSLVPHTCHAQPLAVTVEEHAREIRGVFWRQYDCDTRATPFWMVSKTRADLIAILTPRVGPKRAAELADGAGGDS